MLMVVILATLISFQTSMTHQPWIFLYHQTGPTECKKILVGTSPEGVICPPWLQCIWVKTGRDQSPRPYIFWQSCTKQLVPWDVLPSSLYTERNILGIASPKHSILLMISRIIGVYSRIYWFAYHKQSHLLLMMNDLLRVSIIFVLKSYFYCLLIIVVVIFWYWIYFFLAEAK